MLKIGPHTLPSQVLLAPMAGISDAPFRRICQSMGAGLTTSEMLTAKTELWHTRKSTLRIQDVDLLEVDLLGVNSSGVNKSSTLPRSMQIAGSEPLLMANAAKQCVDQGAEIVDIN